MPTVDTSRTILCRSMSAASPLRASIRPGKGGLKSTDRSHIKERKPGTVESSLDLDTAYTELHPTSTKKRWDYVLGIQDRNASVIAVEVHPMGPSEVSTLIEKKEAAESYLKTQFAPGKTVQAWYWVASGRNQLSKTTAEFKKLGKARITAAGPELELHPGAR